MQGRRTKATTYTYTQLYPVTFAAHVESLLGESYGVL
jgi:hypothetical protein